MDKLTVEYALVKNNISITPVLADKEDGKKDYWLAGKVRFDKKSRTNPIKEIAWGESPQKAIENLLRILKNG